MKRTKGGNPFPIRYFDSSYPITTASAGMDLLGVNGQMIRRAIGGKSRRTKKRSTRRNKKGGFTPSIMEPFVVAAGKYIVPMALYSGYKLMSRGKTSKKTSKRRK